MCVGKPLLDWTDNVLIDAVSVCRTDSTNPGFVNVRRFFIELLHYDTAGAFLR